MSRRVRELPRVAFTLFLLMASLLLAFGLGWRSLVPKDVAGHDALVQVYRNTTNADLRRYVEEHVDDTKLTDVTRQEFEREFWQSYKTHPQNYVGRNVQPLIFAMHQDDLVAFVRDRRSTRTGRSPLYPAYVYDAFSRTTGPDLMDEATKIASDDTEEPKLRLAAIQYLTRQARPKKTEEQVVAGHVLGQLAGKGDS
jgi:hypothetical protein